MKKSRKKFVVIILIILLLALAIGYSAFSATLTINGTVSSTVEWDVIFTATSVTESTKGTSVISSDAKSITTTINNLGFPGDGCTVLATVTNNGTIPAKLTSFDVSTSGADFTSGDLILDTPTVPSETLQPGDTCTIEFVVKWAANSEKTELSGDSFTITYNYVQDTTEFTGTTSHNH